MLGLRSGFAGECPGDVGGHRRGEVGRVPPGGGRADRGEYSGAGPRGAAQVGRVEAGEGGLDARRQVPGVVVEHL
jgi:hypothetical protein